MPIALVAPGDQIPVTPAEEPAIKRVRGRPPGSKNKPKLPPAIESPINEPELTAEELPVEPPIEDPPGLPPIEEEEPPIEEEDEEPPPPKPRERKPRNPPQPFHRRGNANLAKPRYLNARRHHRNLPAPPRPAYGQNTARLRPLLTPSGVTTSPASAAVS